MAEHPTVNRTVTGSNPVAGAEPRPRPGFSRTSTTSSRRIGPFPATSDARTTSVGALAIALVSLAFDGTALPVTVATLVCSTLAWLLMGRMMH